MLPSPSRKRTARSDGSHLQLVMDRKVRAFDPWPRAVTSISGESLLLLKSHVYPGTLGSETSSGTPGTVLSSDAEHGILVRTGEGILAVERLQKRSRSRRIGVHS